MSPNVQRTDQTISGILSLFGGRENCSLPDYSHATVGQQAAMFLLAREAKLLLSVTYDAGEGLGIRSFQGRVTDAFLRRDPDDFFHSGVETLVVFFSGQGGILAHQIKSISAAVDNAAPDLAATEARLPASGRRGSSVG